MLQQICTKSKRKEKKRKSLIVQNPVTRPTKKRTKTTDEEDEMVDYVTIKEIRTRSGKVIMKVVVVTVEASKSKPEKKKRLKKVQTLVVVIQEKEEEGEVPLRMRQIIF